jgi:hypothetical protein
MVPLVVGICVAGTYGLFELILRRKERLSIIEKVGDKLDPSMLPPVFGGRPVFYNSASPRFSFGALKVGCLLIGTGLGLFIGFLINLVIPELYSYNFHDNDKMWDMWMHNSHNTFSVVYGALVLLFGGLGLLISFLIEMKMTRKDKEKQNQ